MYWLRRITYIFNDSRYDDYDDDGKGEWRIVAPFRLWRIPQWPFQFMATFVSCDGSPRIGHILAYTPDRVLLLLLRTVAVSVSILTSGNLSVQIISSLHIINYIYAHTRVLDKLRKVSMKRHKKNCCLTGWTVNVEILSGTRTGDRSSIWRKRTFCRIVLNSSCIEYWVDEKSTLFMLSIYCTVKSDSV